jgi:endonuclease/exonuclease/phosphatase (EEP) superfamily protein YafD
MGKLAVYKYFTFLFLIATFFFAGFTIFGLFGGDVTPVGNTARAMLVYILPLLIICDVLLLIYWLVRKRWLWAAVPLITLMCCIPYCGTLYQFGSQGEDTDSKSGIKVCSYNVALFGRETTGFIAQDILAEMKRQEVEVLCIQEYNEMSGDRQNSESYKDYFPYMAQGRGDMVIFSRFPIKQSKNIAFEMTNNSAMWADIDTGGKIIRVFNVHLQTTGINSTLHGAAKLGVQGINIENNRLLKAIYGAYAQGMIIRAKQAEVVANEIRTANRPVIVCGDFNDVPYSYVYNTMLGDLKDGFRECGSNWMYTLRDGRKRVRIDYIFHSSQLKGISYYKYDLTYSDHYPIFMKLEI